MDRVSGLPKDILFYIMKFLENSQDCLHFIQSCPAIFRKINSLQRLHLLLNPIYWPRQVAYEYQLKSIQKTMYDMYHFTFRRKKRIELDFTPYECINCPNNDGTILHDNIFSICPLSEQSCNYCGERKVKWKFFPWEILKFSENGLQLMDILQLSCSCCKKKLDGDTIVWGYGCITCNIFYCSGCEDNRCLGCHEYFKKCVKHKCDKRTHRWIRYLRAVGMYKNMSFRQYDPKSYSVMTNHEFFLSMLLVKPNAIDYILVLRNESDKNEEEIREIVEQVHHLHSGTRVLFCTGDDPPEIKPCLHTK